MSELQNIGKIENRLDGTTWYDQDYVDNLQQENKQLKSILTELEEWVKLVMGNASLKWGENCAREFDLGCLDIEMTMKNYGEILNKIQELKEMYK